MTGATKMTFDAMAAAVDWFDAYRASEIEALLKMHADGAVVECRCGGGASIAGRESLRVYWERRLKDYPASGLNELSPSSDGVTISYLSEDRAVGASLEFDPTGRITLMRCGPSRTDQARQVAEEYASDQREIIKDLRKPKSDSAICPRCGNHPTFASSLLDPPTGRTFHMFECKCGNRTWVAEKIKNH